MTKMNWDRVRNWDRVHRDLSPMEVAEERDQRWLEREHAREESRGERPARIKGRTRIIPAKRRPLPPTARATASGKAAPSNPATPGTAKLRSSQIAATLGVTEAELLAARQVETDVSRSFVGMRANERLTKAAHRLGVTPQELQFLRRGLNGNICTDPQQLTTLIRRLAGQA